jgi:hypothetical protein
MSTDKNDPAFDETELSAGNVPPAALHEIKESGHAAFPSSSCCSKGMSCRKKIILGVTAALVLLAIVIACSRMGKRCGCRE